MGILLLFGTLKGVFLNNSCCVFLESAYKIFLSAVDTLVSGVHQFDSLSLYIMLHSPQV